MKNKTMKIFGIEAITNYGDFNMKKIMKKRVTWTIFKERKKIQKDVI